MRGLIGLSLALLLASGAGSAAAQDRCYTDKMGATTCTDPMGRTVRGRPDPKTGQTQWRDDLGATYSTQSQADGERQTDPAGNSIWVGPGGAVTGHSDGKGHSIYTDEHGRALKCHDDNAGHHACVRGHAP